MVNYPHKVSKKINRTSSVPAQQVNFANRGMTFEAAINDSNHYYLAHEIAVIHKNRPLCRLSKLTTQNEVVRRLSRPILDKRQLQTTLVFLRVGISISKLKKHGKGIYAHEKLS